MPMLRVITEGEGCWPDLRDDPDVIYLMGQDAPPIGLALLPGGMVSGKASVGLRFTLPDGRTVLTETSFTLLDKAVQMFHAALEGRAEGEVTT